MKLEKLKIAKKTISKEGMSITFGGFTANGTGCSWSSGSTADCTYGCTD